MRFVIAGGGVAGLAAALAVAREGHEAVVLERDRVAPQTPAQAAFGVERDGIPHFLQPHAFLPRGRRALAELARRPRGAARRGRRAAGRRRSAPRPTGAGRRRAGLPLGPAPPGRVGAAARGGRGAGGRAAPGDTDPRPGRRRRGAPRAAGVAVDAGEVVRGDVVVDALGRYRPPDGWPRASATPTDSGAVYFCRYFRLAEGAEHVEAPVLNPRGDLGFMGFNTFRGDNRTFAVILLVPAADRALRVLRDERAWMAACAAIRPLDRMTAADHAQPITGVMPMGGLMNVDRTGDPGVGGLAAVGDALCHTDPAFAYGLSFCLAHAQALGRAAAAGAGPDELPAEHRAAVGPEARERHALACAIDEARGRRWAGEPLDPTRRDGAYALFSFTTALLAAPHDDHVLRRTIRRVGLLDRTDVFDADAGLHDRIEAILRRTGPPPSPGPPRDELLARIGA